jgi:hypothetical protein
MAPGKEISMIRQRLRWGLGRTTAITAAVLLLLVAATSVLIDSVAGEKTRILCDGITVPA